MKGLKFLIIFVLAALVFLECRSFKTNLISIKKEDRIVLIGNNLCSRMMNYGHFETELQLRFPDSLLVIRNICDAGNTAGFRPHPGRNTPWAFPGAENFQTELTNPSHSEGHFKYPDEWLTQLEADVILAFFGYSESFEGKDGIENFKAELEAFIHHTQQQKYNGTTSPQLVLVSPIAFQNLSDKLDLPDGKTENENLLLYTSAMEEVAKKNEVSFVDVFSPTKKWFVKEQLTIDGFQLNEKGYQKLSDFLAKKITGLSKNNSNQPLVHEAVQEKNWFWKNDFKIPNGVHVYGRRYDPFGPDNYPAELEKIRQMTSIRDRAIHSALKGEKIDLQKEDSQTKTLPEVTTNYKPQKGNEPKYLYGEDALKKFKVAEGYKVELFASEKEFPDLANPVQMSFDNQGRLWVAVMPTYPHYKPGDARPNDKLIIFEDTNNDGKADKQTTFADDLHLPLGFEIAHDGVYVNQSENIVLLKDTNRDDKYDVKEVLLSGFDDHDSHHGASAFCADPSGAIYMGEGVFLQTNVETAYGPVRATHGGFYRYAPQRHHLERTAQLSIPNPWGIAFDEWGQNFYLETSGTVCSWMMPGSIKSVYGEGNPKSRQLIEESQRVRPTSGLEFVSSRHFPDEVQGDFLLNNTIGFLGTKQHSLKDSGTGYESKFRQDLIQSSDPNYRPVDLEFAPDGSLFIIDWHNVLIGHMQHNARDPLRDHAHGRIYRITYPARPLVTLANIAGANVDELLENLKLPEYRTRYRTRRELRGRDANDVFPKLKKWIADLNINDARYEHHLLEALWVTWGANQIDKDLLNQLLQAKDFRARAAAVKVLRYVGHQVKNQGELLMAAAKDENSRVRLEALVAASWLDEEVGMPILAAAEKQPLDDWMDKTYAAAVAHIQGKTVKQVETKIATDNLAGKGLFDIGKEIYNREGYCATCHQADGKGLQASGYPPLAGTDWVNGNKARLIKLTLKGMMGPLEINGVKYSGQVPMTPFEGLLNDQEVAAVLTYIRKSFGNDASSVEPETVRLTRKEIADKDGFYTSEELLKTHPLPVQ